MVDTSVKSPISDASTSRAKSPKEVLRTARAYGVGLIVVAFWLEVWIAWAVYVNLSM